MSDEDCSSRQKVMAGGQTVCTHRQVFCSVLKTQEVRHPHVHLETWGCSARGTGEATCGTMLPQAGCRRWQGAGAVWAHVQPHSDCRKAWWVPGPGQVDMRTLLEEEPSSKAQPQHSKANVVLRQHQAAPSTSQRTHTKNTTTAKMNLYREDEAIRGGGSTWCRGAEEGRQSPRGGTGHECGSWWHSRSPKEPAQL